MLCIGASLGSAGTISYWVDVYSAITTAQQCIGPCPSGSTSTLATPGGPDISLTIPKFDQTDANPGMTFTLTGVNIALDWRASGDVTVYNLFFNASIPFTTAFAKTDMTLTADGTQVVSQAIAASGPGAAPCCNLLTSPFNEGFITLNGLTGSGSDGQNSLNFGFFLDFGNNTFTANLATTSPIIDGISSDLNAGHLAFQGAGQMGAIATVTYSYTEVAPEPLSFALVGSSLVALGLVVRGKRDKKAPSSVAIPG
jgi:hypothetical protein